MTPTVVSIGTSEPCSGCDHHQRAALWPGSLRIVAQYRTPCSLVLLTVPGSCLCILLLNSTGFQATWIFL